MPALVPAAHLIVECCSHIVLQFPLMEKVFNFLLEELDTGGRPCEHYRVVALGAGRSSCGKWLCYNGTMVHDCHAIVIARRALLRYELLNATGDSDLESHSCSYAGMGKLSVSLFANDCIRFYFEFHTVCHLFWTQL